MKIIICDDERMDAERAKTILLSCKGVQEEDIAILDIEYENRQFNGITLSKELNKKLPLCQIIYLTWVLEFAPEVYDTIHCYFVLKQNEEKMLPRAMEKAIQIYCDQEDHEIIELRNHGKMMYIRQADIIYAERQDCADSHSTGNVPMLSVIDEDYETSRKKFPALSWRICCEL